MACMLGRYANKLSALQTYGYVVLNLIENAYNLRDIKQNNVYICSTQKSSLLFPIWLFIYNRDLLTQLYLFQGST